MNSISIRFGPATVSVSGGPAEKPVLDALARWLGRDALAEGDPATVHITVSLRHRADEDPRLRTVEHWWDGKAWDAAPRLSADGSVLWPVHIHESAALRVISRVPGWLTRWAHVHRFDHTGILASALLYGHVLPAAQEALRRWGASLVHASAIATPDGDAVVILGRGGAGKTSASTHMYLRQPQAWRFMSDDLAIIGGDGTLYRSPVPLNVFPYNTQQFPQLWELLAEGMSAADRLHWRLRHRILGASGVARRRAPFAACLGPPTGVIRHVVEVRRTDVPGPVIEATSGDELAHEARHVLAYELRRGFEGMASARAHAAAAPSAFLNPPAMLEEAERVMKNAFSTARLSRMLLPRSATVVVAGKTLERAIGGG